MPEPTNKTRSRPADWKQAVAEHRKPALRSSVWQLVNSVIPYLALWGLMIWTLSISYWITLALAVVAGGFLLDGLVVEVRESEPCQGRDRCKIWDGVH